MSERTGPAQPPTPPAIGTIVRHKDGTLVRLSEDVALQRGWALRWGDLRRLVEGSGEVTDDTPVVIINRGGGVQVLCSTFMASDGVVELTVRPS